MMTPAQSRAARGLIDWTQTELAKAARVSLSTVRDFETGKRQPLAANVQAMRAAIEAAGVIMVERDRKGGAGVRLR